MLRIPRAALAGLAVLTAFRLALGAWIPLGDDETFYWEWSRHLAPGYVDHPPMIAFLVWAATHIFGSTPFAVHSVGALLSLVASLAVWVLAREALGADAAATWSVVLFNVIPVFSAGALLAAPDAPLGICWVLTLLWAWRAARRDPVAGSPQTGRQAGRAWLAAGAWLGLALDSKYTAAVLPVSIGLWLALSPAHRRWLRRREPYRGLALAAVLFTPVLWWNAAHRWRSFTFTFIGRPSWREGGHFPEFLMLQFVYLAPLMFPVLLWALGAAARRGLAPLRRCRARAAADVLAHAVGAGSDRWLFLAAAGLPVIAGMFAASLLGHIKGHWPAPGYVAATIALAGIATERSWVERSSAWRAAASAVLGSTVLMTAALYALPALAPSLLPPRLDPTVDYDGWPEAAQQVAMVARQGARGPFFITSDRYQVVAQFDFATLGRYPAATVTGQDQYDVWTRWADLRGQDGLFIRDGRYPPDVDLNEGCRSLDVEPAISIVRRGVVVRTLGLVWCRGFEGHPIPAIGGPHWGPGVGGPGWHFSRAGRPTATAAARDRRE